MKRLLISVMLLCITISAVQAQNNNNNIDVYLNNYQNNHAFKATSEKSTYFAQAFFELVRSIKLYKDAMNNVEGNVKYVIRQIPIQRPLTRSNGQKIYNGYVFNAIETVDNAQNVICTFVYDIDSNALYNDINNKGRYQKLLYANREGINKCARYCRFNN